MSIRRGEGTTKSERKLAEISEQTFLNLWSYPNTFIDRKQHGKGAGNEFCDLLVVCGDDVILFSDKSVEWPSVEDVNLAWSRWYRRAIEKSVGQIRGAASWITKHPNRVFLDKECTKRLPIDLPPPERMRVHGIAVAVGANAACQTFFNDNIGTFAIRPALKDRDHINPTHRLYMPFALGDADAGGPFVHVFDERSLDIIFHELNTISDFVEYLTKRAKLIREEKLLFAPGEEDLIAHYLKSVGPDGTHDFTTEGSKLLGEGEMLALADGTYEAFISNPQYQAKKEAEQISYAWDALINSFTTHILAGTTISLDGEPPMGVAAEPGLRIMSLENRVQRRLLSHVLHDAIQTAVASGKNRYFRTFFPRSNPRQGTAYVVLLLGYDAFYDQH